MQPDAYQRLSQELAAWPSENTAHSGATPFQQLH